MRTARIFEVNEEVMIKCRVTQVIFEGGNIKYKLADSKGGTELQGNFTDKELIEIPVTTVKKRSPEK